MLYYTSTHADVAESFLLGLSCLVGGDQFYIFISKTDASPNTQSYIAITAVLSTLFLAFVFYDEYNRSLFDVTHVLYLVLLVIWGLILYQNVRNPFITTYYTSILGMVMTFLVIISCVHYSHQKDLLPSFLSGMLCARLLPTLLWIFVHQKKAESKSNLRSLSARLAFFRLVFCIISMILKFTSGNLDFSLIKMDTVEKYEWCVIRPYAFKNIWERLSNMDKHFTKLDKHIAKSFNYTSSISHLILIIKTPLFLFFSSIVLYLANPPIVHKFSHMYSSHLYSRIDIIKTVSHVFGVALGTKYPVSKTANSYSFTGICLCLLVYFFGFTLVNKYWKFTSPILLYTMVGLNGFILGYVLSYSLGILKNTLLNPTCFYEDLSGYKPCCGEKTENQCYCKLRSTIAELNKNFGVRYEIKDLKFSSGYLLVAYGSKFRYANGFSCSKSFQTFKLTESFSYHPNALNAILLLRNESCETNCDGTCCTSPCKPGECCLKLVGKYKIQSVTTSTCQDCQLTIRIEASCTDPSKCPMISDSGSSCSGNGSKCCLCLKCCKVGCQDSHCKCCIHVCNSNGGCTECCKKICDINVTRLFICFKNGIKCCIREIKPNLSKGFIPDLKIQNEFDIKSIFFSDCCHNDLAVIIQCSMKNNFFRVSPINYPKKSTSPYSLTLMRNGTECCKSPGQNCCCKNTDLVTVCVKYDESESNCKIECKCKGTPGCCCAGVAACECCCCVRGRCCCCCVTCELAVNGLTSFYNRIEPVRVKLVLILWFFFLIFLMIVISETSKIKNKILKYYQFFPIRTFEIVNKEVENNGMNSMNEVLERLRSAQTNIFLELFGEKDKKTDLDHMLHLCKCAFDPCSLNTLRHYVLSKSSMLIASPQYANRRLNLELVKWSYCVGFVYTYIMLMFFNIQDYFLKWEEVWIREYLNYKRIMSGKFNNLTQTSKSSMSLVCEKGVDHKTTLYTDKSKKGGWDCSHDELDIHANLNERETEMNKSPPHRVDLRLMFFLDKWKHRVENLIFWTQNETNVYDWTGLIEEYPKIRTWFFKFLPHIQAASHEMNVPIEKLNKGTEILENKPLDLIS